MSNIKKIKVITSSCPATGQFYVSPINWFLKLTHQSIGLSKNDYFWQDPLFLLNENNNFDVLVKIIKDEDIDILAFSVYVWNCEMFFTLAKKLKQEFINLTIIVGGPEIDAHKNNNFFIDNPFIDFAIYGDGESAFTTLLDNLAGYDINLVNVVDKFKIYPHEVFNNKITLSKSPYIVYKKEIYDFLCAIKKLLKFFYKLENVNNKIILVWETTKGCPYACSFCDWSSGLHNKVRIWGKDELHPNWQKEIDIFFEWELENMYWTNPNVGLTPQDEHIVEYWCNKKISNNNGPEIFNPQWSKLHKKKVFYLLDKMIVAGVTKGYKFDLQDLDPIVLTNINRPEIPWHEHKKLIKEIKNKHGNISKIKYTNRLTFIWGLPGQTLKNLETNMIEAGSIEMFAHHLPFEILPNTPAANDEYKEKFKLLIKKIEILGHGLAFNNQIQKNWIIPKAVVSTYSLSENEWFEGIILFYIYNSINSYDVTYGKEQKLLENKWKIQNILNESFDNYLKTGCVAIFTENKMQPVYNWVSNNLNFVNKNLYNQDN